MTLRVGGIVLIGLLAAACSAGATPSPSATIPVVTPTTEPTAGGSPAPTTGSTGVVVNMATTSLGPVLTGPNGLTLYTHAGDSATASTCTGTFATLTRDDGTVQVTYNGLPLYGWKNDAAAGDVTGQGINGFAVAVP
jgi:predicted lipoprotein with Yx(FWY)xxD motif